MEPKDERRVDEWLDQALAECGNAEPRAGLENRVLAHLRAERESAAAAPRWWLVAGVVATAAIVAAVWLGNRSVTHEHPVSNASVARAPSPALGGTAIRTASKESPQGRIEKPAGGGARTTQAHATPRLEQFPSPQPLSTEEEQLARYVRENHAHALLLAQAQTELLNRDREEELRLQKTPVGEQSDQPER
jgi:hypothetical protein